MSSADDVDDATAGRVSIVVGAGRQVAPDAAIEYHHRDPVWQADVTRVERSTVDEQRVIFAGGGDNELIHDSAVHAGKFAFSPQCQHRRRLRIPVEIRDRGQRAGNADFERRRRRESRAGRQVACQRNIRSTKRHARTEHRPGDAGDVAEPPAPLTVPVRFDADAVPQARQWQLPDLRNGR